MSNPIHKHFCTLDSNHGILIQIWDTTWFGCKPRIHYGLIIERCLSIWIIILFSDNHTPSFNQWDFNSKCPANVLRLMNIHFVNVQLCLVSRGALTRWQTFSRYNGLSLKVGKRSEFRWALVFIIVWTEIASGMACLAIISALKMIDVYWLGALLDLEPQ